MTNNEIRIEGNLSRDPELKYTQAGHAVASLNVAVNRPTKEGQESKGVDWFSVTLWREQAEAVCQRVQKGDRVLVIGRMQSRSYETQDGQKKQVWDIMADVVYSKPPKGQQQAEPVQEQPQRQVPRQNRQGQAAMAAQAPLEEAFQDDIPF